MSTPNTDQRALWNDLSGPRWVAMQPRMDAQLAVYTEALLERLAPAPGMRALDVGCGCGATTLALARAVGPGGRATGVDVSAPMLDRARERAAAEGLGNAAFHLADAQSDPLPGVAFDLLCSRFGVMFFDDPRRAFAHLRASLAPGARVAFVCWQPVAENPWVTVPRDAALTVLPEVKLTPPRAPGPFAFCEEGYIREVLEGYADVAVEPHRAELPLGGGGDLDDATDFLLQIGPTAAALREATAAQVSAVRAALREALAPHAGADGVRLAGATWVVTARNPG